MAIRGLRERKNSILSNLGRIDLIEQERNLNHDLLLERTLRRRELEELLLKEEIHWRQKSRVKWIKKVIAILSCFIEWSMEGEAGSSLSHWSLNGG